MSFFSQFSKTLQSSIEEVSKEAAKLSNDISPLARRTARLVQEKFGSIEDISELPEEYIQLEKKCDALNKVYNKLVTITSTYEIESYDYPPNLKESVNDLSKTITDKFTSLNKATTTEEISKNLNEKEVTLPKTLAHEISKAAKSSHDLLLTLNPDENALSKILLKFSESQSKIGFKRIDQDNLIIENFNNKLFKILQDSFKESNELRKKVEISRLNFDTLRYDLKLHPERQEESQEQLDKYEDELVNATTLAVKSMKKLIEPTESINLIILFNKIQLDYHKSVVNELEGLIKELENVPIEDDDEDEDDDDEAETEEDISK